ncbi:MAG: UDP-N-acetylglucosamine--N-acetylmuramyl-(pentapeptide) pyrophosphoryl-undecaprenol N-acetylglucosamine transferase [Candidatus Eremiobacteraeota bacterium]|nr:UDP-N-acetylglucosamine--N-acetylmuramyl-(pentapeptide) pyrophosphoryl-undecaprenol N-acetylglucosamine transferase [Candidatus Eremiobacteraeota bacterium]
MRILLTGGGTGGHLYPALSLARALSGAPADPGVCAPDDGEPRFVFPNDAHELLFVGTRGGMETQIVERAGVAARYVRSRPLSRSSLAAAAGGVAANVVGTTEALPIVQAFKPDVIIATGGYASVPVVMAAATLRASAVLRKARIVLLEPNVEPGRANRFMAGVADEVWGAFAETAAFFGRKFVVTGMPVRPEIAARPTQVEARRSLGLDAKLMTAIVFGGSQGARSINVATSGMVARRRLPPGFQLLHIAGERDYEWMAAERKVEANDNRYRLVAYIDKMELAYAAADIAVCRAGASTLAELAVVGLPSILIPYPHAADDHQRKNAEVFTRHSASALLEDKKLDADTLYWSLIDVLKPERLSAMRFAATSLAHPRALQTMIERIVKGQIGRKSGAPSAASRARV